MYIGYRLKINNVVLPNSMIAKGTYNAVDAKRVVETWKDANLIEHEITVDQTKAKISFSFREHDSDEHGDFVAFLQDSDDITVEYYSDRYDTYKTVNCRMENVTFSDRSTYGGKIQYNATPVTLIEN